MSGSYLGPVNNAFLSLVRLKTHTKNKKLLSYLRGELPPVQTAGNKGKTEMAYMGKASVALSTEQF